MNATRYPSQASRHGDRGVAASIMLAPALVACLLAFDAGASNRAAMQRLDRVGQALFRRDCKDRVTVESVSTNAYDPEQPNRIERWTCGGIVSRVLVSRTATDPTGMLLSLEVGVVAPGLPRYLQAGQPIATTAAILGPPDRQTPSGMVYSTTPEDGYPSWVTIRVEHDRIVSVRWDWYVD